MDLDSARSAAEAFVADLERKLRIELVLLAERTIEFSSGWVFFYDSRKHVESRSIRDALGGNSPVIVSKRDGSVHFTGTARPIEDYIREFERNERNHSACFRPSSRPSPELPSLPPSTAE